MLGRGGQKFIERCVSKVAELRARFPDKDIEVDGGVGPKTVDACAEAGMSWIYHVATALNMRLCVRREQCHCSRNCDLWRFQSRGCHRTIEGERHYRSSEKSPSFVIAFFRRPCMCNFTNCTVLQKGILESEYVIIVLCTSYC